MTKTSKKKTKKINLKKYKKELMIGGIILVVALACLFILLSITNNNDSENTPPVGTGKPNVSDKEDPSDDEDDYKPPVAQGNTTEEKMIEVYGMSKEDAINIVKAKFNSDNFEFEAIISKDAKYVVTAKNTITKDKYNFEVDPITKESYEI